MATQNEGLLVLENILSEFKVGHVHLSPTSPTLTLHEQVSLSIWTLILFECPPITYPPLSL